MYILIYNWSVDTLNGINETLFFQISIEESKTTFWYNLIYLLYCLYIPGKSPASHCLLHNDEAGDPQARARIPIHPSRSSLWEGRRSSWTRPVILASFIFPWYWLSRIPSSIIGISLCKTGKYILWIYLHVCVFSSFFGKFKDFILNPQSLYFHFLL